MRGLVTTIAIAGLSLAACSNDEPEADPPPSAPSSSTPTTPDDTEPSTGGAGPDLTPETVLENLDVPWGIAFLPDGSALIAQRDEASVLRFVPRSGQVTDLGAVDGVAPTSEGGLLGLAVSPDFDADHTVFAYLTTESDNRVVALTLEGGELSSAKPVLTGIPRGDIHDGGRLAFGPDGKLYVTTGETGEPELAQDPDSLGGKILRINPDGSVPDDNPEPGSPVWTLGHRNVQGITWDDDGRMWASEFGSSLRDEVNLIEPGNNYGWPAGEGVIDQPGFTDPLATWPTGDLSPSGIAYLDGSLYVAGLIGNRMYRIPVDGADLGKPEALYKGDFGRLRTVVATPDGALWFTTSNQDGRGFPADNDDRVLEIQP